MCRATSAIGAPSGKGRLCIALRHLSVDTHVCEPYLMPTPTGMSAVCEKGVMSRRVSGNTFQSPSLTAGRVSFACKGSS